MTMRKETLDSVDGDVEVNLSLAWRVVVVC